MELNEALKGLKTKGDEIKKISGFNSKHFAFKNWHATVMQLLRELPSSYQPLINEFKKLTFENTGFKRGKKSFPDSDNSKYIGDLEISSKLLDEMFETGKKAPKKKEVKSTETGENNQDKPEKLPEKNQKPKKTAKEKSAKRPLDKKPAKSGTSSTRKKKK